MSSVLAHSLEDYVITVIGQSISHTLPPSLAPEMLSLLDVLQGPGPDHCTPAVAVAR
jgi:hypothetical protein